MCVLRTPGAEQATASSCHFWLLPVVKKVFSWRFDETRSYWTRTDEHERSIFFLRPATNDQIKIWVLRANIPEQMRFLLSFLFLVQHPLAGRQVTAPGDWILLSCHPPRCPPARLCWDALLAGSEGRYFNLFAQWLLEYPTFICLNSGGDSSLSNDILTLEKSYLSLWPHSFACCIFNNGFN